MKSEQSKLKPRHPSHPDFKKPHRVIQSFFSYANIEEVRQLLWRWLQATITGSFNKTLKYSEREGIVYFYCQVKELIEAVYVLYAQNKKNNT